MRPPSADPLIGTSIGQYEVLAKLGGGGMGVVYAARDSKLDRRVALKFLPPQWSHDEDAKQRFIREAQAASATDHRNICTIHDIDTAPDGRLFIVMAHYDGPTLKQKIAAGGFATDDAIEIAAQMAEGLARAHAQGVVHRDVKPGNVILTDDGVRLLDFGLARFAGSLHLTMDGSTLGTVAYMSPEQARGDDADGRSDVWSIGVVLYEMLTGELPFKGAYAEAMAHAIRSEPAPTLQARSGENIEALERVVRRALEKDPAQRYQSARDLARDLRLLQGRTLPIDLRTGTVVVPTGRSMPRRYWWKSRGAVAAAIVVIALSAGIPWLFMPAERQSIAIVPVVNQTGYAELDPYRLALTQELIAELSNSPAVRVLPYDRVLPIVRRYRVAGEDVSSRQALQAIAASGAQLMVVPTLLYENGAWRARIEFRSAATATNEATFETPAVVSSLIKDTAYRLMPPLAAAVQDHVVATGPKRVAYAAVLKRLAGWGPAAPAPTLPNVDAAAAFEAGIDAYERLEYGTALAAFATASAASPRDPLLLAWRSRTARIMRYDRDAADFAAQASALGSTGLAEWQRLFVEAVAAEGGRATPVARERYTALVERFPDEARWLGELGGFQDREEQNVDAIASYQAALALDAAQVRPHLELCRLYNRLNESANAREQAQKALAGFRAANDRWLEAQALFCLSDTLRTGGRPERDQARAAADEALKILEDSGAQYQLGRAYYYVALAAGAQGRLAESLSLGETGLARLKAGGNTVLQPLALMNMGVASNRLGQTSAAIDYYRNAAAAFEALGDERRAAQTQSNSAAIIVQYGGDRERGMREAQNALQVSRKLGDKLFEAVCLQLVGAYYRDAGSYADAERTLRQALAIARERNLADRVTTLTIDLAAARGDQGDLTGTRQILDEGIGGANAADAARLRLRLAHVKVALGDLAGARADLTSATSAIPPANAAALASLVNLVAGKLAYESGELEAARQRLKVAATPAANQPLDANAIEALGYLALIDAQQGRAAQARSAAQSALTQARALGRQSLIDRCAAFLAQIGRSVRS